MGNRSLFYFLKVLDFIEIEYIYALQVDKSSKTILIFLLLTFAFMVWLNGIRHSLNLLIIDHELNDKLTNFCTIRQYYEAREEIQ